MYQNKCQVKPFHSEGARGKTSVIGMKSHKMRPKGMRWSGGEDENIKRQPSQIYCRFVAFFAKKATKRQ